MLRILIADEHRIFSEALQYVLSTQPLFRVVCSCDQIDRVARLVEEEEPDIVFLDGSHHPATAIEATRTIKASSNSIVIALSRHMDTGFANAMLHAGALGYLTKNASASEFIKAITEVMHHGRYTPEIHDEILATKGSIIRSSDIITPSWSSDWYGILRFAN